MTSKTHDHPAWTAPYLARLGIDGPESLGAPSLDTLRRLHRAHVELVAFENFDIQLGRPQGIDPAESIARILAGRGGYCFNLNNAFHELLTVLGYDVTMHRGQINGSAATAKATADDYCTHMALTVVIDGERWSVDVGLANSHHEPIPLREGVHVQGPFRFELRPLPEIGPDAWRFLTDPEQTTFHSMDFTLAPATWEDFQNTHSDMSTSPRSSYVMWFELFRRDAARAEFVLDDEYTRDEGAGRRSTRILQSAEELFEIATHVFHLDLSDVDDADRTALWERIQRAGAEWRAKQQSAKN
ncbi:arylamine N-acetyltransferase family protein [Streptacidiphilus jiangxiensis]|uniref:Arylamine N-acetyltransferase n=1 Tax=Streptacidiphilus jiangxiensis TaxID=235985 RepID=A0A1H7ZIJ9_STRJI|nr:arylamine N-acetyltransferase [Streptacidiphilus jiangxiensis]SEM58240.1 Arylamine N-acetyltransferase [Streptacidiphilus jiangxiensis]